MQISHRFVESNGIKIHIAEAGAGPLVLLCHGFPESWYSWRHQIEALSEAGYHVVAPDMRGYGQTDRPQATDKYSLFHLVGDMVGLVNAVSDKPAVVIGHDWGAPVAWHCALFRPDRFRAVAGLSVPFRPRGPAAPTSVMPQTDSEIFYQLYFQPEGVAERELEQDIRRTMRLVLAGRADNGAPPIKSMVPRQGGWLGSRPLPSSLPNWITEADIDFYVAEFERTGFRGGLNWYRNVDHNWELMAPWSGAKVTVPALYMAGELDLVVKFPGIEQLIANLNQFVPQLQRTIIFPDCGHWTQQEKAVEVNSALITFLKSLDSK
ncbi:MAG TPA: alpha/beta hydrolase [Candidatus Acidoferrum sp.]|nr:alpha/beta hydrolase [Candidatus Acidoferrum sp.]